METSVSSHEIETPKKVRIPRGIGTTLIAALAAALGVAVGSLKLREDEAQALMRLTQESVVPTVALVAQTTTAAAPSLTLPGTLQAYISAPIHARVAGYLESWHADIGTRVRAGQLLAQIDTPELDQQLLQAEAGLETAKAQARLADTTARRWQALLKNDSVSQQETDEKVSDAAAKQTIVQGMQANLERIRTLQAFKRVTAPFDGVVTERKTDVGDLINAGAQSGHELFFVADVHKLRLYVNTPQAYANRIRPGMNASLEVNEHPGRRFNARVVADAGAVNEAYGTVLVQLEVDNAARELKPGDFASVHFDLPADPRARMLPASALVLRSEGPQIVTVGPGGRAKFHAVRIGRDLGQSVEIIAGLESLNAQDRIIDLPPETLADNDPVRIKGAERAQAAAHKP
jgi:RND family efflux transporter MFP subunit